MKCHGLRAQQLKRIVSWFPGSGGWKSEARMSAGLVLQKAVGQ